VALDVIRAIRREDALPVLMAHLNTQLDEAKTQAGADADLDATLRELMPRVVALARTAEAEGGDRLARRAASALYHLTTAVAMVWEASRIGTPHRQHLARLVLTHRLLPVDPLAIETASAAELEAELLLLTP
jgi:hypothetical protein